MAHLGPAQQLPLQRVAARCLPARLERSRAARRRHHRGFDLPRSPWADIHPSNGRAAGAVRRCACATRMLQHGGACAHLLRRAPRLCAARPLTPLPHQSCAACCAQAHRRCPTWVLRQAQDGAGARVRLPAWRSRNRTKSDEAGPACAVACAPAPAHHAAHWRASHPCALPAERVAARARLGRTPRRPVHGCGRCPRQDRQVRQVSGAQPRARAAVNCLNCHAPPAALRWRAARSGARTRRFAQLHAPTRRAAQGLGNDFIIIDNRSSPQPVLTPEQVRARRACRRGCSRRSGWSSPNNWPRRRL